MFSITTYLFNIVDVLEPTPVMEASVSIRTDMSISAVNIPTIRPLWTAASPRTMLQRKLLSGSKLGRMTIITVFASLAFASQMEVVANLPLGSPVKEALLGARVGLWDRNIQAFLVLVKEHESPVGRLLGGDDDTLLARSSANGGPGRLRTINGRSRAGGFGQ